MDNIEKFGVFFILKTVYAVLNWGGWEIGKDCLDSLSNYFVLYKFDISTKFKSFMAGTHYSE
jgi:hypothetical protein